MKTPKTILLQKPIINKQTRSKYHSRMICLMKLKKKKKKAVEFSSRLNRLRNAKFKCIITIYSSHSTWPLSHGEPPTAFQQRYK